MKMMAHILKDPSSPRAVSIAIKTKVFSQHRDSSKITAVRMQFQMILDRKSLKCSRGLRPSD